MSKASMHASGMNGSTGRSSPPRGKILIQQWRQHYNTIRPHSARIQASSPRASSERSAAPLRYIADPGRADNALTSKLDHSVGAGHGVQSTRSDFISLARS